MGSCRVCGAKGPHVSEAIRVCRDCLVREPDRSMRVVIESHKESRLPFRLPGVPPRSGGVKCVICSSECALGEGEVGYCGIRWAEGGRLKSLVGPDEALLHYYLDPHVTNCCNAWFCPGGCGTGYPRYSYTRGPETGYYNLALFFYGCDFNCLFCQNWEHKLLKNARRVRVEELVGYTLSKPEVSCWCWFGGSPEPQLPFAVKASRAVLEAKPRNRILRICYEWNGTGNPGLVRRALEDVVESGGNVKFDLKAYNNALHVALTGQDNKPVLRNFELVYDLFWERRRDPPVLGATTLLVPYYVNEEEVESIARFIASLDPEIPYNLLVFHPDYLMSDSVVTPVDQARRAYLAARKHLKRVNVSNLHLLGYGCSSAYWLSPSGRLVGNTKWP